MKQANNYLSNVRKNMHNYRNASGSGTLANTPGRQPRKAGNWNAGGGGNAMPSAPYYVITVSNASNAVVQNFPVLGASQFLQGGYGGGVWDAAGDFTLNGVTISSGLPNITYQQMLSSTNTSNITIGMVYLESLSGSTAQVTDIYNLISQDASGKQYNEAIKPFKSPNQFQNGITVNNTAFNVTGLTTLTWKKIYELEVFQISLFLGAQIDPAAALNGESVQSMFTGPNVIGNIR